MMRRVCLLSIIVALQSAGAAEPQIRAEEGRAQVAWQDTKPLVGQKALVFGTVRKVNSTKTITFLDFDDQRPARFTGVIKADNLTNFPRPPKEMYAGKIVRILGTVSQFKGQPQMEISKPTQIEILDAMPQAIAGKAAAAGPRGKPGEVVVAAYNLLNLFDEYDDPYREDEGTAAKPRTQLEHLAASIRSLNADVITVEEVENRDVLERFVNLFLADMGYKDVVLFEGNDHRGIDVGLISRVPVGDVISHRHLRFPGADGQPARFNRDVLTVNLEPKDAQPFQIWVVHLKSNSGGREAAEPIRLAESREVRALLDKELSKNAGARILVMGDFNDTPESKTIATIVGQGERALWPTLADLQDKSLVSYNEGKYRSIIDFILCTPAMHQAYVPGSFHIPQGSIGTTGSDHNPIVATFNVK
jgi:endonuclease/exonuclease/phosphatase family metal-dependent hydrolase